MGVTLVDMAATQDAPDSRPTPRAWRYRRVGALVLSPDFYLGMPIGLAFGVLPAISNSIAAQTQTVLLGASATAAALTGLVLTAISVLVGAMSPAFNRLIDLTPNGLAGLLRPYLQVVIICAVSCGVALFAGLSWPILTGLTQWGWLVRLVATGLPIALLFWGLGGSIQLVGLTAKHMQTARKADQLEQRVRLLG